MAAGSVLVCGRRRRGASPARRFLCEWTSRAAKPRFGGYALSLSERIQV